MKNVMPIDIYYQSRYVYKESPVSQFVHNQSMNKEKKKCWRKCKFGYI
jgi:hypothetical protein